MVDWLVHISEAVANSLISLGFLMGTPLKESDFSSMDEPDITPIQVGPSAFDDDAAETDVKDSYIEREGSGLPAFGLTEG